MANKEIIALENHLHGIHTRNKELHYSADSMSIHKLIDEFDEALLEFDDSIMEEAQSLYGVIQPGDLDPVLPESMDFEDLLGELKGILGNFYKGIPEGNLMWIGIRSEIEGFWHTIGKYIYLIRIAKGGHED